MSIRIMHLSDLHHMPATPIFADHQDARGRIQECAVAVCKMGMPIDAVVISGDLLDRTSTVRLETLHKHLRELADHLGAALLITGGNHDFDYARAKSREDAVRSNRAKAVLTATTRVDVGGLSLLGLYTRLGTLEPEQLAWLQEQLETCGPRGYMLVLHHPPIESLLEHMRGLALRGDSAFEQILQEHRPRLILAGHYHHTQYSMWQDIPVWIGPALSYHQEFAPPRGKPAGYLQPGFTLVQVDEVDTHVMPIWLPQYQYQQPRKNKEYI